jgi:uncharacterized membrane protein
MGVVDGLWLKFMLKNFYMPNIGHLFTSSVNVIPAIIFYLLYAIGVYVFVVNPGLENSTGYLQVFAKGLLLGLVVYGAYDLTNHATLKNWPYIVSIVDMAWGSIMTGLVSLITTYLIRTFF